MRVVEPRQELRPDAEREGEGQALAAARELAAVLAAKAPGVMRRGRADFLREFDSDYRRGVANAVENFVSLASSAESREGIRAFVEKRPPAWTRRGDA